jgi:hypothetical protein
MIMNSEQETVWKVASSHSLFPSTAIAFALKKLDCSRYSEEENQCFQHGTDIVKYWLRILQKEEEELLRECYEWQIIQRLKAGQKTE